MRINIFGDFKSNCIERLRLSENIRNYLEEGDVNLVNFEAPVRSTGEARRKSGPSISQDIDAPIWLKQQGVNAISLANNHTMDYGEAGLCATQERFDGATIMGAGEWHEAYKIHKFKSKEGLSIGIICCTHCEFGTLTEKEGIGCAWTMSPEIIRLIKRGQNEVDFLIVMPHAGVEYMDQPLPEWREVYKLWIDLGADAVIGSHPHVPQGWEFYNGKPICYSLGNLCFNTLNNKKTPSHWFESLCCSLTIEKPHECKMDIRPLIFDQDTEYIGDNDSEDFMHHINKLNEILMNDDIYLQEVNKALKARLPFYLDQFTRGGMTVRLFSVGFLKGLIEGFMGRGFFSRHHAINNIRCESHRWAILRAINLK